MNARKVQQRTLVVTGIQFKVQKGMEIPPRKFKSGGKWKSLFLGMKQGECVTLPDQQQAGALAQSAYKQGGRIIQRKTDNGITCWKD